MNRYQKELQKHITETALNNGALLIGYTKIRKVEPVIIMGFPFSDKWFLKNPVNITLQLGRDYLTSRHTQDLIVDILKGEGFKANYKTVLSVYGDFRPLAVSAGLGEWGRNGLVVNKRYGSSLLFCAVFTNAPLKSTYNDNKDNNQEHCIQCEECIKACPGNAFENNTFYLQRCLPFVLKGCAECLKTCRDKSIKKLK